MSSLRKSAEDGKAVSILPPVEVWEDERAQRNVHIGRHEAGYRPVVCWQNAEDEKWLPIQVQRLPKHGWIPTESPLPAGIAENRQPWITLGAGLVASEDAANACSHSQAIEEVRGDRQSIDAFDVVAGSQIQHGDSGADHVRKDLAVAKVTIVEKGELIAVTGLDTDDAGRVDHGGNPQENR